ncbi:MAG TPA: hypothetical protein VF909_20595, partial [Roseiflexaceae bacterium]
MFRSLRWRLTGWYVLLLAGVLLLFSAGTYLAVRELLLDNVDDVLRHQAALVAQTIDLAGSAPVPRGEVALPARRDSEHFTRLYRANGTLSFDDNATVGYAPRLVAEARKALRGAHAISQVDTDQGAMRVGTFPIQRDGQVVGALQVGLALEDSEDTLQTLLKVLLALAPAML